MLTNATTPPRSSIASSLLSSDLRPDARPIDTPSRNTFVKKLKKLAELSDEDVVAAERLCAGARRVEAGADLLREGNAPDGICVVLDGFACRYRLRSDGARQITDYFLPGDCFDLGAFLSEAHDFVSVLSASKIARVPAETILDVRRDHPLIGRALDRAATVEAATLREWLMNLGRRSAEERIAHLFCELFARMQTVGLVTDDSIRLPLTQFDLGDTMGLSYVHVNRTLQSLRHKGLFVLKSKTLTILDLDALQKLGGFNPSYLR